MRAETAATPVVPPGKPGTGTLPAALLELPVRYPALTVSALAALLGLLITAPLGRHLGGSIYGPPGDNIGTIGVYWNWVYAVQHGRSAFDNQMWGAPLGAGWDTTVFTVLQAGVSIVLTLLVGPTVAYNLEVLSSFPLIALTTFLLARRLGMTCLAAALAALAFTFMPYHTMKSSGHLGPTHMELLPAFLLFMVRWRQDGTRWNLLAAGAIIGLSAWVDPTMTIVILPLGLALFLSSLVTPSPNRWRSWRQKLSSHVLAPLAVGAMAILFVPAFLLVWHRPGTGSYVQGFNSASGGVHRKLIELTIYSARVGDYITPWYQNPLTPSWVRRLTLENLHGSNLFEQTLFVGYTVITLALVGLLFARRAFPVALATLTIAFGFVMALQPYPHVAGVQLIAPSAFLYLVLPIFRVYASFGMLVLLGAVILAGLGFEVIQARLARGPQRWLLLIPFLLVGIEFNNLPPTHTTRLIPAPTEYTWLAEQPAGILVEYPLAPADPQLRELYTRLYQFYQTVHHHPTFNGAAPDSAADRLAPKLEPYYGSHVANKLGELGIRYVFVHRSFYLGTGAQAPRRVPGLTYVTTFGDTDVFEVSRASAVESG